MTITELFCGKLDFELDNRGTTWKTGCLKRHINSMPGNRRVNYLVERHGRTNPAEKTDANWIVQRNAIALASPP